VSRLGFNLSEATATGDCRKLEAAGTDGTVDGVVGAEQSGRHCNQDNARERGRQGSAFCER
jgi:hypothetical protein